MRFLQRLTGKKPAKSAGGAGPRSTARYLRDTPTGIIRSRHASLSDSRDDIRRSWRQAASLALDIVQNSGRLKGMVDQVLADTVGVELVLNPQPDLAHLGYDQKETTDFIRLVKKRWKKYAWNAAECDFRGKFTLPQQVDIALRWHIVYGEVTGILDYMPASVRRRYGIRTGTKLCLVPPTRLVQDTNEFAGLFQGVYHDDNGRVSAFLLEEKRNGFWTKVRYPARDGEGRTAFLHVFDPVDATDVRGISVMAAGIRKHLQHETLEDVTLQTSILQTFFAAVLTSDQPSADAFEALDAIKDIRGEDSSSSGSEYVSEFVGYLNGSLERAAESRLTVGSDPQVSHLAPGEDFEFKTANTPGPQYQPLSASLSRDMARSVGITYGALTMDHTNATYSSTRMENSSIWPVVARRRERIAAPVTQTVYELWLEEEIATGRLPLKGGLAAFEANRDDVTWAQWQGPAKPTADDLRSAKASSERLANGTSSVEIEAAELGVDPDELFEERHRTHERYLAVGMRSPYERATAAGNTDPSDGPAAKDVTS
ncbi:lambda family phage portal protein [Breoghania corrubedonensis]|uniref:Lambda family phage portal protein n=1 Tax=Breoghania corrubedonensis TaxID=665038 RepID=A0A2T5UQW7_9HYPH|nr:phage portal protein [Breoghania corrubedonensis]PTW53910.1 lambda family phage portal protein [Breoghania corrubedonensis]